MIPLSLAAAVVQTSRVASRLPFFVAMIVMMLIGVLPAISHFLAAVPTPVAYAALFITYTKLLGFGLKDFATLPMDERTITVGGSSLLAGIGIMFVPSTAWQNMPPLFSFLFGNGLLLGVIVSLVLEHIVFRKPGDSQTQKDGHTV
jgi:xanthine/uracil permease